MPGMLRTTTAFTIGMHAMALLGRNPGRMMPIREIADICGVSEAHLAKVLHILARGGFVKGARGPSGGIELNVQRERVSLMDIWNAIEGPAQRNGCPFSIPACKAGLCHVGQKFEDQNQQIENLMKETTLIDLGCSTNANATNLRHCKRPARLINV